MTTGSGRRPNLNIIALGFTEIQIPCNGPFKQLVCIILKGLDIFELLIVRESLMSSANKYTSLLIMWGMLLTNIVKSRGPNRACGTPLVTVLQLD